MFNISDDKRTCILRRCPNIITLICSTASLWDFATINLNDPTSNSGDRLQEVCITSQANTIDFNDRQKNDISLWLLARNAKGLHPLRMFLTADLRFDLEKSSETMNSWVDLFPFVEWGEDVPRDDLHNWCHWDEGKEWI